MGFSFRKSKKIAPGLRLNLSKSGLGLSAGVRGARVSKNMKGETHVSAGRGGLYYRKRLKKGGGEQGLTPEQEEQARNLEFGAYLMEKAQGEGLTGPGDEISDELMAEAAEEFFGSATSPDARAAISYVNDSG